MSLLNQVLQDLDARQPDDRPPHLHLAEPPRSQHAPNDNDFDELAWRTWLRPGFWSLLLVTVLLASWAFQRSWELAANTGRGSVVDASSDVAVTTDPARNVGEVGVAVPVPQSGAVEPADDMSTHPTVAAPQSPAGLPADPVAEMPAPAPSLPDALAEDLPQVSATAAQPLQPQSGPAVQDAPETTPETTPEAPPLTPWQQYLLSLEPIEEPAGIDPDSRPPSHVDVEPVRFAKDSPGGYLPLRNVEPPAASNTAARRGAASTTPAKTIKPLLADPLDAVRRTIARGDLAEAESQLRQRLQAAPRDRNAHELLIGLMLRGERSADVLSALQVARKFHPTHGKFLIIEARLLAQSGSLGKAVDLLESTSQAHGIRVQRLQMLGALLQQQGRYQSAAQHYRSLLALTPGEATAWMGLAICLDALGNAESADTYRRALHLGGLPATAERYARQRLAEME